MIPKISIIIATYNRAHFIEETLQSIQKQTFNDWECLIIDDGGNDNTAEVIVPFLEQDTRFQFLKRPDSYKKGLPGCRNYGLDIAKGIYIQFFDDDDIMHPKKLELQVAPFLIDNHLNFTVCKFESLFEKDNREFEIVRSEFNFVHPHLGDAVLSGSFKINSLSTVWKKSILLEFRFDEDLKYAEEWELYTRIGYKYPTSCYYVAIDDYLFTYRKHSDTLTMGKDLNYERRKTSAIIRIKIQDYLNYNKLHTKMSILFLAKTFLVYFYNPNQIKQLINYIKVNKGFSLKLYCFLKVGLVITKFHSKLIAKLASWI